MTATSARAPVPAPTAAPAAPHASPRPLGLPGAVPAWATTADLLPWRAEAGVGALMPWAGSLWMVTYVAHKATSGSGTGLFEITPDLALRRRPESVVGTYANRMVHHPSSQLIIGPHLIDAHGHVRTFDTLTNLRLCGTCEHLTDPENKCYFLGMEGEFVEADVHTLQTRQLFDLTKELQLPESLFHFKACHTAHGRVVVVNNCNDEREYLDVRHAGRLAEWTGAPAAAPGAASPWTILERKAFYEVHGRRNFGSNIFATGWDHASAILQVFNGKTWLRYRLPKATQNFEETVQCEWPRIRELEHERFLMDCHGLLYELSPHAWTGTLIRVRPICSHLMVISEMANYRGLLVFGGNQNSPGGLQKNYWNLTGGDPTAGLWAGHIDDLWRWGKPTGFGGPWWRDPAAAGQPSDPFLMAGFDKKCLHFSHNHPAPVELTIEIDFLGDGSWQRYATLTAPARGYAFHPFPDAFSAHWVRVTASQSCQATAQFTYT